jgi:pyruvate kinase
MNTISQQSEAGRLLDALRSLRVQIRREGAARLGRFARDIPQGPTPSAANLAHYLALRTVDIRPLQAGLSRLGLSSLGRSEAHVLATLDQVMRALASMTGQDPGSLDDPGVGFEEDPDLLGAHARALFGPPPRGRDVRIMVTLPTEAASSPDLVRRMVATGMDWARINCAHDDREAWIRMIGHVREAEEATGRTCRIQMDLAGHKLRTGTLAPAAAGAPRTPRARPAGPDGGARAHRTGERRRGHRSAAGRCAAPRSAQRRDRAAPAGRPPALS